MRRTLVVLAAVLLAGGAWIAYTERWRHGGARPVAWHDLGAALGRAKLPTPVFLRFRKRRYLESYLTEKHIAAVAPPVDFTRDEALLAAAGARSSTGYGVRIESISEQRSRIVVRVRETTPSLGQPVAARVTYPYLVATIPQSPKRVHFIWLGRP